VVLAAELGLAIIAEGIEGAHQERVLRELGVSRGQGYLYGKPAPVAAAPALSRKAIERAA
jgi:sensor c-di-GMP phosphodiesterase-like protein